VFIVRGVSDYSKFEIKGENLEFCDPLYYLYPSW